MIRAKGKLIAVRKSKKSSSQEIANRALLRAKEKLGEDKCKKLQENEVALEKAQSRETKKLKDGLILSLLQQNLSNNEIRQLFLCGNSRINRLRNVLDQPTILDKLRPKPKHAVTKGDLDAIETHLSTFETEDGFPCAHRRLRKFFIVQGLTWTKI